VVVVVVVAVAVLAYQMYQAFRQKIHERVNVPVAKVAWDVTALNNRVGCDETVLQRHPAGKLGLGNRPGSILHVYQARVMKNDTMYYFQSLLSFCIPCNAIIGSPDVNAVRNLVLFSFEVFPPPW